MKNQQGSDFPIAIKVRLKHGILVEAIEKRGWSQRQAADFLGISQLTFGLWINMKRVPRKFSDELVLKLSELTGKSLEELWPEDVFTPKFLAAPKTLQAIREVPVRLLASYGLVRALPATPEEEFERTELKEAIREALDNLPPRQRQILKARYLEGQTLEEVGQTMGLTRERVRHIEIDGLQSLKRYPRNKKLRALVSLTDN